MKTNRLEAGAIIKILKENREALRDFGVRRIGLFGSFSRKEQKNGSDLNFLVVFSKPSFDNYMELKFFLEDIFKKNVDLVIEKSLKPSLKHVKKEALYVKGL